MFFKCKMCGGSLEFEPGDTIAVCDSCGTKQTLPRLDNDRRANLYDRANHFRRNNEFDKAAGLYEQILNEDPTDAEAYWSLVLCRYGIEYVEDPATHKRVPTINRTQFTSIYDDEDYKSALQHAGGYQRTLYEEEASTINEIQKGILAISQMEEPFDVFICYKETDANGRRTPDSVLANDLYHQLIQEGFKVFFARITLEDKLGTAYEPYIFAALNSAKVMVVLGTKPEYFNAVWVKNEWSRYLSLVNQSGGKKVLIPAYRDMDPYDLPEEFSHLQAQDMSKLGFLQDLIRGIKKIAKVDEPKMTMNETVVIGTSNVAIEPLIERIFLFLEDGNWQDANIYCEKVLDKDPKNAEAYLGKLMVEMKVRSRDQLADCPKPFNDNTNYSKILRFGDEKLATEMLGYIEHIKKRNENDRLIHIYNTALSNMKSACTESAYKDTANTFKTISGFKDADALAEQCLIEAEQCRIKSERLAEQKRIENERIETARLNDIYKSAVFTMKSACTESTYKEAVDIFKKIPGFRDADALAEQCLIEIEHLAEQKRIAVEKKNKKQSKVNAIILTILGACVIACIVNAIVQMQFVIPNRKYNSAVDLYNAGKYDEAIGAFKELNGYKDSEEQITKCETTIKNNKYNRAMELIDSGDYEAAYTLLNGLDYKDSASKRISIQKILISNAQVGSYVSFGLYEQDNDTSNGKEAIEWRVLAKEDDRVLLISRFVLDSQVYDPSKSGITWENSSLRKWLNDTFLNTSFSEEEKAIIPSMNVETGIGKRTTDQVFLLSYDEALKYFSSDEDRRCVPTPYAVAQAGFLYDDREIRIDGKAPCFWWLRSPSTELGYVSLVLSNGELNERGVDACFDNIGVRPAVWVKVES